MGDDNLAAVRFVGSGQRSAVHRPSVRIAAAFLEAQAIRLVEGCAESRQRHADPAGETIQHVHCGGWLQAHALTSAPIHISLQARDRRSRIERLRLEDLPRKASHAIDRFVAPNKQPRKHHRQPYAPAIR